MNGATQKNELEALRKILGKDAVDLFFLIVSGGGRPGNEPPDKFEFANAFFNVALKQWDEERVARYAEKVAAERDAAKQVTA